ncbi:hypothetical protein CPC735_067110 [Coccidioides posadasii C735 delta SOWgp]|uniref:Signal recognition particle subunit SRP14 n=3 Tax=Coccidioides TaxID=5500 RepID=A0A0J6YDH1_COCIT|nr:hypothetical protein CPC735_067110 [Coccidioides posadasii C735 delta SOWgp]EER25611.1 hypothetical protein CPC735_067110 [Coccidioides posadasii C735 delta SOWgp]KMM71021.1 hypothetical protein CPAG_07328 [Coccidioides posadasii RMSCC 3488]KMP05730.1 hypothetical protein CIRG_05410 [Coccidioides immitis RMSCC 2394]|eukprot:XP_003067756.1 hypothetical protein CPC735_067110 [Coccidioides posadasii C735 delta SOWgp]
MTAHLSQDEFFTHLTALLTNQSTSLRGSVFLTQKLLPAPPPGRSTTTTTTQTTASAEAPSSTERTTTTTTFQPNQSAVLIRASNGRHKTAKVKASTIVQPEELEAFYARYAELCKAGMVGLKKRDRSAKKKGKAKGKVVKG